jgi:hypothetical protein
MYKLIFDDFKDFVQIKGDFEVDEANGKFDINDPVLMVRAFNDYISFVIEKNSIFSEVEYKGNDHYYPIRPFNLYPDYEYAKNDTSHLASIVYGVSSDTMVAVLIEHKG